MNTGLGFVSKQTPPWEVDWMRPYLLRKRHVSKPKTWVGTVVPMSWVAPIVWTEDGRWTDFQVHNRRGRFGLRMPGLLSLSVGMSLQFTVINVGKRTEEIVAIHRYAYGRTWEQIYPAAK